MRTGVLALVLTLLPLGASAQCRQALALGLDVSGSVDAEEYDLQLTGLAQALLSPLVREAFLAIPGAPVDLFVYEWSGPQRQTVILDWTTIGTEADLAMAAEAMTTPGHRPREAGTAVGQGMMFGAQALAQRQACARRTLDISADGKSNMGPRPRDLKDRAELADLTINALVIGIAASDGTRGDSIPELSAYYRAEVIRGPDAFIEVALGYHDYREAMEKKLIRELETLPIGRLPAADDRRQAALQAPPVRPAQ